MLIRTTYLQLTAGHRSESARKQLADQSRVALAGLSYIRGVTVAVPLESASAKGWDMAIHLQFDDADGVAQLQELPGFAHWRDEVLGERMAFEKTWLWEMV